MDNRVWIGLQCLLLTNYRWWDLGSCLLIIIKSPKTLTDPSRPKDLLQRVS